MQEDDGGPGCLELELILEGWTDLGNGGYWLQAQIEG
jgi:hypothetical protein